MATKIAHTSSNASAAYTGNIKNSVDRPACCASIFTDINHNCKEKSLVVILR